MGQLSCGPSLTEMSLCGVGLYCHGYFLLLELKQGAGLCQQMAITIGWLSKQSQASFWQAQRIISKPALRPTQLSV